jgi:hypothetical protein
MSDPWTNERLQADPQGYLKWQEEQRTKAERERKEAEEESDFQSFAKLFEERGGNPLKSREMYERYRNDMALEEAKALDQQARNWMRTERNRVV